MLEPTIRHTNILDDYQRRRDQHFPENLELAAKAMARQGSGDYSIADALRLDVQAVRKLIGAVPW